MKKHTKLYIDFFGYQIPEDVCSEISGSPAADIHHISPRGMGGSKTKDYIENLVALTRDEHRDADNDKTFNELVQKKHIEFIKAVYPDYELREGYEKYLLR